MVQIDFGELNVSVGSYSIQGRRLSMEDEHVVLHHPHFNFTTQTKDGVSRSYFAVFDGHGGNECARYAANNVHGALAKSTHFQKECTTLAERKEALELAFKEAFARVDEDFLESKAAATSSGSTGVVCLIEDNLVCIANVGDSRAVLCQGRFASQMSFDHKPNRRDERERILGKSSILFLC